MDSHNTLQVTIEHAEFAKAYNYFVTVQLDADGQKRRTDVSANVTNPVFTANNFFLPLMRGLQHTNRMHFACFVVMDRVQNISTSLDKKGTARLLGECALQLGPLIPALSDISGVGVRQSLKFLRIKDGKEVTVGRFIISLRLVSDSYLKPSPAGANEYSLAPPLHPEIPDEKASFRWRVRADFRGALDVPVTSKSASGLPSCYMECGWSSLPSNGPSPSHIVASGVVDSNRHPVWNQQMLLHNPPQAGELSGYIWVVLRDKVSNQALQQISLPMTYFKPFVPYNFEFLSRRFDSKPLSIFTSLVLETPPESLSDTLAHIYVTGTDVDPPQADQVFIQLTSYGYNPKGPQFMKIELKDAHAVGQAMQNTNNQGYANWISPMLKLPSQSKPENKYNALTVFSVPKSYLDKKLQFFMSVKDEREGFTPFPNTVAATTGSVDAELKKMHFASPPSPLLFPMQTLSSSPVYSFMGQSKCRVELLATPSSDMLGGGGGGAGLGASYLGDQSSILGGPGGVGGMAQMPRVPEEKEKWQLLSKELAQKQELIHRMMKDLDEKTHSLKITAAEIVDLRRNVKLLQSENAILRKKLGEEEQVELSRLVSQEIAKMSVEELKNKILKLAQAYRAQRLRNEEFERTLRSANEELVSARKLKAELDGLQQVHQDRAKKLLDLQRQIQKTSLYKDTIRKQERVIAKLESLMERTLKDTQKARTSALELEKLRGENASLQKAVKDAAFGPSGETSEIERMRRQNAQLEQLVDELKDEVRNKRPMTSGHYEWENEKIEFEVKLQKADARIMALNEQLELKTVEYAKEMARLKMIIAEKQNMLDQMSEDVVGRF